MGININAQADDSSKYVQAVQRLVKVTKKVMHNF
jgi:hypothetical protein